MAHCPAAQSHELPAPCSPGPEAGWGHSGTWILRRLWPSFLEGGTTPGEGWRGHLRLGGLGPPECPTLQTAPCCPADHEAVLPGASLPGLVRPALTTRPIGLSPSVSLWSLAGVPWPRARLQPGKHQPPSMALCFNTLSNRCVLGEDLREPQVQTSVPHRRGNRGTERQGAA